jgi:rhodanese-related sulfurtransferase
MQATRAALGALGGLGLALAGCGPLERALEGSAPAFEEVEAERALALIAAGDAALVQAAEAGPAPAPLDGASLVDPDAPLPQAVADEARTLLVVARDLAAARRLAARLARAGAPRVAVVQGGIQAWLAARGGGAGAPSAGREPDGAGPRI